MKADYLASRYAVLKDRIQNQYTGDRQVSEMAQLERLYSDARDEMANTYAKNIGGFYEGLGQTGVVADMKASVTAMVDEKASAYSNHLTQAGGYAQLSTSENLWLKQDDAYVAARLRESAKTAPVETPAGNPPVKYDANDLTFAGAYAKSLSSQLKDVSNVWDMEQDDSTLGNFLAEQILSTQEQARVSGVGSRTADLINNTFESFMNKFMDALDHRIDKNQNMVNKNPWMQGTIRTTHIDRSSVFRSFQSALGNH